MGGWLSPLRDGLSRMRVGVGWEGVGRGGGRGGGIANSGLHTARIRNSVVVPSAYVF